MASRSFVVIIVAVLIGVFSVAPLSEKVELKCRNAQLKIRNGIRWQSLRTVSIATCFFMLFTYIFAFTNGMFLFDASFINRGIGLPPTVLSDKWFSPFLSVLDMGVNMPWLAGVWATLFLIVSIYCMVDILDIQKKWSIFLVSGLCVTNSSIICQQEYTGGNYTGEAALLFACLAAWFAVKCKNRGLCIGGTIICIALSSATYGAYVSVAPCLMIMKIILDVCHGKPAEGNWKNAFSYCIKFILGMLLYYIVLRLEMHFLQLEIQQYMGEDTLSSVNGIWEMLRWIPAAYKDIVIYYLGGEARGRSGNFLPTYIAQIMTMAFVIGIIISAFYIKVKSVLITEKKSNILLLTLLLLILPAVINLIFIMASGSVHFLMIFTYVMPFLLFVKEIEELTEKYCVKKIGYKKLNIVYSVMICLFIFSSIIYANAIFSRYYGMFVEAQSIGTRILDRIENCEDFDGTERVVIIGAMQNDSYYGVPGDTKAEILDALIGCASIQSVNGLNWGSWVRRFLINILGSNMEYVVYGNMKSCIATEHLSDSQQQELVGLGYFPRNNSVKKIGNTIYVKFPDA